MLRDVILAIDDDPCRYQGMIGTCAPDVLILVAEHPDALDGILGPYRGRILGVCLDYDLTVYRELSRRGAATGLTVARDRILGTGLPAAVVSSNPAGNRRICDLLAAEGHPYVYAPANTAQEIADTLTRPWWDLALRFFRHHWDSAQACCCPDCDRRRAGVRSPQSHSPGGGQ